MASRKSVTQREGSTEDDLTLRQKAETVLQNDPEGNQNITSRSPEDWQSLLHELRVHQIELEMQNEELRRAQTEAESARDRYINLYDFAPVGYLTLRQPGVIKAANLTAAQMLGVPRGQLIGNTLSRFVFADDQNAFYHYLRELFTPEARGILELRMVQSGVTQFYARLEGLARDGEDLIQLIISDITDLKQAEQALKEVNATLEQRVEERTAELRESEQRYSVIFDESPIGIALVSLPGSVITSANDAFLELFDHTPEEVIGKKLIDLGIPDPNTRAEISRQFQGHSSLRNFEFTRLSKSGDMRFLSSNLDWVSIGGEKHVLTTIRDITERRRATEALRKAHDELELRVQERTSELGKTNAELKSEIAERLRVEDQLRLHSTALEAAANGIVITGRQGDICWANPAFTQMTGYALEEIIGKNLRLLKSGQHTKDLYHQMWETILSGHVWQSEMINRRKDGSLYFEDQTITPLYDETGEITNFIAIKQDITERKQSEQVLKDREALFRTAFETMPLGIWLTDDEARIIYANPAVQQIWAGVLYVGVERYGEYKGWWVNTGKLIAPEEWASARAAKNGEISVDEEIEIECFDGRHKIILNSAIPVRDERGKIINVFVINQDITRRKRMEQEIVRTNELLEKYFSSIDTMIAYLDRDFNFIRVNEAYARSAGHSPEYYIGKNHFGLFPHPENQAIFQQVVDTGVPYSVLEKPFEYSEFPERGVSYWDWSLQPVTGGDNRVSGLVLTLYDVTERKRAEQQLERQNQDLREMTLAAQKQRELAEGLTRAVIAVNANLDPEQVLDTVMEQLRRSIPFTMAGITEIEGNTLRVVRHSGLENHPEAAQVLGAGYQLADYSILKQINSTRQPVYIEDTSQSPVWSIVPGLEWVRSLIAAPLIIGGKVAGMIMVASDQPGAFSQGTVSLLMAFAASVALAVQNARLYAAETRARQIAETMSEMSLALTQTLNLDTVLETLLGFLPRMVSYDGAYVVILQEESRLSLHAINGYANEAGIKRMVGSTFDSWEIPYIHEVISTRKSLLIPDTHNFPGWETLVTRAEIRNWLGVPILLGGRVLGVLGLVHTKPDIFTQDQVHFVESVVSQASVAIQNSWLFEQVRAGQERFQLLSRRLVEVQESERRYIARELHDETSQALTAIMFGLGVLEQEVDHPVEQLPRIAELKKLTDEVLENLHRIAVNLRPASLDHLGLVPALHQLVKDVARRYRLNIRFRSGEDLGAKRLPDHIETTLYRIVQEALTNAARHARANNIDVILESRDRKLLAIVEDDGVGFDVDESRASDQLGLVGMQERAQMMGGILQVESRPGGGTTIVVEVNDDDSHLDRG